MTASTVVDRPLVLRDGRQVLIRRTEPDDAAAILAYLGRVGGESINLTFGAEGPGFSEEEERGYLTHVATAHNSPAIVAVSSSSAQPRWTISPAGLSTTRMRSSRWRTFTSGS